MACENDVFFEGGRSQIRLLTLICSDSFAFDDVQHIKHCHKELLLLHIQLNEKPRDEGYKNYRRRLYQFKDETTEVIALNWAEKIEYHMEGVDQPIARTNISGSTWHLKSRDVETGDALVEANHRYGLYYTYDTKQYRHILHFTYKPAAFLVQSTKVFHYGVDAARSRRIGPEVIKVFHWNSNREKWDHSNDHVDDGFHDLISHHGPPATELNSLHASSPLAVERLLSITCGEFGPTKDWYRANKLDSAAIDATEIVRRVTVRQDPDGANFRDERIKRMKALGKLRATPLTFTPAIADLSAGFMFVWSKDHPHCNVVSIDSAAQRATLIYAGEEPSNTELSGIYAKVSSIVDGTVTEDRFGVLYRNGSDVNFYEPSGSHSITKVVVARGTDFTDPEK